ncbi:hypothetical protein AVEN_194573-1 [Araneus ventricosus]|uniref:Uncharacterized protein n=1 Tax=Araneus ventricosus TaxID=182803 RepID=A0A4Y2A819_ARAVE|nr:hypothetical protein AVEN_194573-1 [Araneus ventricosus]
MASGRDEAEFIQMSLRKNCPLPRKISKRRRVLRRGRGWWKERNKKEWTPKDEMKPMDESGASVSSFGKPVAWVGYKSRKRRKHLRHTSHALSGESGRGKN